ncbi:lysylphosphatidylglycerol synthase transmembrane domain-containing protein [Pontibacter sp. G13]|uniref:lysylphosphatidylglycerol synthase transmembrane domain-containing protein n=1 Tax=Pontibacter sp. G13 TaxID=3074898 RepID=UPI002889FA3D|nr:lysylphosphatidylglycerol synthase transmembrane domain-containing protein [Pontibacter sp. G13]WNJ16186.1 lysylphosphatidylglycerol synthase transmembrane domain-containing protein [Pontibacter sp. G13]
MNKEKLVSILKYLGGIGLGVALMYFAFQDTSIEKLKGDLANAHYGWLIASISIGLLSHFLRSVRWNMQLTAAGHSIPYGNTFAATMVTYLVNMALPRAGEVARCTAVYKTDRIPVATSLGTVVIERAIDAIILLGLIFLAFSLEADTLTEVLASSVLGLMGKSADSINIPLILGSLVGIGLLGLGAIYILRNKLLAIPFFREIWAFISQLLKSTLSIKDIDKPWLYVVYTISIWVCYWLMTYVAFFSMPGFEETSYNWPYLALITTVIGGIGMALPIPGGVGSYHQAIILTFTTLVVLPTVEASQELGQSFALLLHSAQMVMLLLAGLVGYMFLMAKEPKSSEANETVNPQQSAS